MKKNSIGQSRKQTKQVCSEPITIGMDLGDKSSCYCVLNGKGEVVEEGKVATTKKGLAQAFGARRRSRMALEVGTHSPWVSRLLSSWGHEVIVANARQVKLISHSSRKDDRLDAQTLARLARVDPQLLRPIRHRGEEAQLQLMAIRVRAALVEARTALVNTARGLAKSIGERLPALDTSQWSEERIEETELPEALRETLRPLIQQVAALSGQIRECDRKSSRSSGNTRKPNF
jgi:transposase